MAERDWIPIIQPQKTNGLPLGVEVAVCHAEEENENENNLGCQQSLKYNPPVITEQILDEQIEQMNDGEIILLFKELQADNPFFTKVSHVVVQRGLEDHALESDNDEEG